MPSGGNPRRTTNVFDKFIRVCIVIAILLFVFVAKSQTPVKSIKEKVAPGFYQKIQNTTLDTIITVTVQLQSVNAWDLCIGNDKDFSIVNRYQPLQLIVIKAKLSLIKKIINCSGVLFADEVKQPKEELLLGFTDYATNGISLLQSKYPQYNGNGLAVSVKENSYDTSDIDFKGRILSSPFRSGIVSGHASAMATIIAGGGNSWNYTKGSAWKVHLSSASFSNLLPEPPAYYQQPLINVQNHSYGTLVEQFYGAEAAAYDASVNTQPSLLHVFSVGNSGTVTPASGKYAGINGYANMTGNFKQAKNSITVGHIDSFYNVLPPSSKGPSFDGRMKPELVAFGEDGSSGAAALVSGIAISLQQAYQQLYGSLPNASLIKSVLLNSADDVGTAGNDFASGFGNTNGYKAMQNILNGRFINSSLTSNAVQTFTINLPTGIKQLKLTLVWTDVPSAPNTTNALIHDLDLELQQNSNLQIWQPWVLSSSPNIDSLQKVPIRKRDTLNNAEQITINDPQAGSYTIRVTSNNLTTPSQSFAVAWQLDSVETFQWYYPSKTDHLLPIDTNVLRWQTTYNGTGELQISTDDGNSWQLIDANINLNKGWFKYAPPPVYKKALLRMRTGTSFHVTDTFTISKRVPLSVGFNCADSVMLNWQPLPGVVQYRVLRLGNQYMEAIAIVTDTFFVFNKAVNNSLHYAVEPLYQTKPLVRSYTLNYDLQGAGCYIRTLLADLTSSNNALLQLQLSTAVRITSIVFEKLKSSGFIPLQTVNAIPGNLTYAVTDLQLNSGPNIYRAAVVLSDGRKFYSNETILLYNGSVKAVIYPNPVSRTQMLQVLAKPEDELTIQLITNTGIILLEQKLNDVPEQINIQQLSKGVHYYRILNKEKLRVQSGIIVVQ